MSGMTDKAGGTAIRVIQFDGNEEKWREFYGKTLAIARMKGWHEAITAPSVIIKATNEDGTPKKLSDEEEASNSLAIARNNQAMCYLTLACVGKSYPYVEHANNDAHTAWKNLCERFQPKGISEYVVLIKKLTNLRLRTEDQDPDEWFHEMEHLQERLSQIDPKYKKTDSELKAQILAALPKNYSELVTYLEMEFDSISLINLKKKVRNHWQRQKEGKPSYKPKAIALAAWKKFKGNCNFCGKQGHKKADCFKFKQSGEGNNNRNAGNNRSNNGGRGGKPLKCYRCQKEGHIARNCPEKDSETGMFVGMATNEAPVEHEKKNITYADVCKSSPSPKKTAYIKRSKHFHVHSEEFEQIPVFKNQGDTAEKPCAYMAEVVDKDKLDGLLKEEYEKLEELHLEDTTKILKDNILEGLDATIEHSYTIDTIKGQIEGLARASREMKRKYEQLCDQVEEIAEDARAANKIHHKVTFLMNKYVFNPEEYFDEEGNEVEYGSCPFCDDIGVLGTVCPHCEDLIGIYQKDEHPEKEPELACVATMSNDSECTKWLLDSGASVHITNTELGASNKRETNETVTVGNGEQVKVNAIVDVFVDTEEGPLLLQNVYFVPQFTKKIISLGKLLQHGSRIESTRKQLIVRQGQKKLTFRKHEANSLYYLEGIVRKTEEHEAAVADTHVIPPDDEDNRHQLEEQRQETKPTPMKRNQKNEWDINDAHDKMGHANESTLAQTIKSIGQSPTGTLQTCDGCARAKARQKNVSKHGKEHATKPGERIMFDTSGPYPESLGGNRYHLCIKDEYSKKAWSQMLRSRKDVPEAIEDFLIELKAKGYHTKFLRCDNAGEHTAIPQLCKQLGIQLEYTSPYTPQFNGSVEREITSIREGGMAQLFAANLTQELQKKLWAESFLCRMTTKNILVTAPTNKSPDELFTGTKPTLYPHLIEFGRIGYVTDRAQFKGKMKSKSYPCLMVGYAHNHSNDTYRMYNPATDEIILSRDIKWADWRKLQPDRVISSIFNSYSTSGRMYTYDTKDGYLQAKIQEDTEEDLTWPTKQLPTFHANHDNEQLEELFDDDLIDTEKNTAIMNLLRQGKLPQIEAPDLLGDWDTPIKDLLHLPGDPIDLRNNDVYQKVEAITNEEEKE